MATFAVEVWSWKLCQIKDPLVFGAAIRGSVNQNIVLRRVIKTARRRARLLDNSMPHEDLIHLTADPSAKG